MAKLEQAELYSSIIKKVIAKEMTQKAAAIKLEISDRQVRRLIAKYNEIGENAFIHQNSGKSSHNKKIPTELADEIVNVYLNEYADYSFQHFYEEHGYKYGIAQQSMINIFIANEIISPYAQHRTVKLYNENMKNAIKDKTITEPLKQLYEQRKQEELEKHHRKSSLHYAFGEEVQMDAAFCIWFGQEETVLHLSVDKGTGTFLGGHFANQETTDAYLVVLMAQSINYGFPKKIKTDRRNTFSINNTKSTKSGLSVTQFKRICEDLEISLICNSNPVFKPNVERANGTFKRRLKAELKHEKITNINDANKYLNDVFIPKMNKRFACEINPKKNVMRPNSYTEKELNFIISIREKRTIDNASSIKYYYSYYLLIDESTGEVMSFKSGTECIVVTTFDKKLYGIVNDETYLLYKLEQRTDGKKASKNGFKPSLDNPWRKFRIR